MMRLDYDNIMYRRDQLNENGITEELLSTVALFDFDSLIEETTDMKIPRGVLKALVEILHIIYNKEGKTFISDDRYDVLYEMNKRLNGVELSDDGRTNGRKIKHKYPHLRGTIGKVHFIKTEDKPLISGKLDPRRSYEQFLSTVENATGKELSGVKIRLSLKVDGVSAVLELEKGISKRALKRGDTDGGEAFGEEILILRDRVFSGLGQYDECGLKTEVYMSVENFNKFKAKHGDYDTPRSAISSIVNRDDFSEEYLEYINIYDIEISVDGKSILHDYEDSTLYINDAKDYEALGVAIQRLQYYAKSEGIPADGVVIRLMDDEIIDIMGRDKAINNFEIAYKFPMDKYEATLKHVNFSMGLSGAFTPVAEIEPIDIAGVTITNISIGSIPRLLELDLRKGQTVLVTHDVIPYLYDCEEGKENFKTKIEIPVECPICGQDLEYEKSSLMCINDECDGLIAGSILRYIQKMGIADISYSTVNKLMEYRFLTGITDLYFLQFKDLSVIPGFGKRTIENILLQIDSNREVKAAVFFGALGIPNVGRRMFESIFKVFSVDEVKEMFYNNDFSKLTEVRGVGKLTIAMISNWNNKTSNHNMFKELLAEHITLIEPVKTTNSHTILFTKVRDNQFQEYLENAGYTIANGYKKDVDVVIYGGESSKTEKAAKDGKLLLTLQQAYEAYGYNPT